MTAPLELDDAFGSPPEPERSPQELARRPVKALPPSRNGTLGRELPNNQQAEAGLLSAMLIDAEVFVRTRRSGLYPEAFYSPAHRIIFEAILELHDHGELPNPIAVCEVLRVRGDLEAVGGIAAVESLANYVETTAHSGHFLKIVQDKFALRQAIRRATSFVEQAYEFNTTADDLHDLLAKIGAGDLNGRHLDFPGRKPSSFMIPPDDDPSILLGTSRYICRGDGGMLVSNSGVGKSSWSIQAAYHFCLGRPFMGIACPRPLRILIVQSEDADGDIAECCESCRRLMKLTAAEVAAVDERLCIVRDKINRGDDFIRALAEYVRRFPPDVVMLNPLHAYAGCDISDAEELGRFLRQGLNKINEADKFAYLIIHHTPKPPVKTKDMKERQWNEVMYEAAGSAELINWARFIIILKARVEPGKFDCVLAKRGRRAGVAMEVLTEFGRRIEYGVTTIPMRHTEEQFELPGHKHKINAIYWEPLEEPVAAVPPAGGPATLPPPKKETNRGPACDWDRDKIVRYFPQGQDNAVSLAVVTRNACETFGLPKSTWHRIRNELLNTGRVFQTPDGRWFRPYDKPPQQQHWTETDKT